jgi:hypothetical protein
VHTEKFNKIYKSYNDLFVPSMPSFHNLLWQIIVNETLKNKTVAFYVDYTDRGAQFVIACNDGGYIPTGVFFTEKIGYNAAADYCSDISQQVFDLSKKEIKSIVTNSFRLQGKK